MWSLVVNAVTGVIGKWQDSKAKKAAATAAWETAMGRSMENSWKDEYITILITLPLWQIFIGNLIMAFNGSELLLLANQKSLDDIGALMSTPYGDVMMVVVLAAVGLRTIKGVFK